MHYLTSISNNISFNILYLYSKIIFYCYFVLPYVLVPHRQSDSAHTFIRRSRIMSSSEISTEQKILIFISFNEILDTLARNSQADQPTG